MRIGRYFVWLRPARYFLFSPNEIEKLMFLHVSSIDYNPSLNLNWDFFWNATNRKQNKYIHNKIQIKTFNETSKK